MPLQFRNSSAGIEFYNSDTKTVVGGINPDGTLWQGTEPAAFVAADAALAASPVAHSTPAQHVKPAGTPVADPKSAVVGINPKTGGPALAGTQGAALVAAAAASSAPATPAAPAASVTSTAQSPANGTSTAPVATPANTVAPGVAAAAAATGQPAPAPAPAVTVAAGPVVVASPPVAASTGLPVITPATDLPSALAAVNGMIAVLQAQGVVH